ncbi:ATP-grasp domain-containing protein [Lactobacillaceae bacterium L1_55_11]|nr:ATP-grasp domain-containing protein [Lactobacillaceae bacterium L1_55_11]
MWNSTAKHPIKNILFIGAGPNGFGVQGENDAAIYQVLPELHGLGYQVFVIDDNPYALSLESLAAQAFWQPLTVENIKKIIIQANIDTVVATFGGRRSMQIWEALAQDWQDDDGPLPQSLGLANPVVAQVNNRAELSTLLTEAGLPVIESEVAATQDEANELMRKINLPLVIRAQNPIQSHTRQLVSRLDELEQAVAEVRAQSLTAEVLISKAINGMKEIGMEVVRDFRGNCMQVGTSEDMDPIGIHSADSLSVSPVLTVQDPFLAKMRSYAFQIANLLQLEGLLHVQFAVDEARDLIYIIKVSPYFDQLASRVAMVTGYPLALVSMQLMLGTPLEKVYLPHDFNEKMAMMEPMMDHIAVKLPIFPFGDLAAAGVKVNRQLGSIQKSVGGTVGFGRTFVEALEKAIRSAHFNNRSFSPTYMAHISDDELIQQLIHPEDNRVLLFIEALRRGYEVDELAELSHVDEFYFYQLQSLIEIETAVERHPDQADILLRAKRSGLSDGLIARFWRTNFESIRQLATQHQIEPTYKAVDPSAGEFPENAHQYYASFEFEDESTRLSDQSILVVGSGAYRIGETVIGGYASTIILSELRRLQYQTVMMNNNSQDATLLPHLSDKQYLEPLEISDVMAVVDKENPKAIMVPGNRRKLIRALKDLGQNVLVIPKDKHLPGGPGENQSEFALNFFYDGQQAFALNISQHRDGELRILPQTDLDSVDLKDLSLPGPGLFQLVFHQQVTQPVAHVNLADWQHDSWLRPMPFGQIAFLSKATGVQWFRLVVRALLGQLGEGDYRLLAEAPACNVFLNQRMINARTDFQLHLQPEGDLDVTRFEMGVRVAPVEPRSHESE